MATLFSYGLVVCDKFYKENASWQLVPLSSPPQSCPYGLSVHAILSPVEAP